MRKHGISDDDAAALVTGEAPAGRPELTTLARSIAEFHDAAFASAPRPSAELRRRLDLASASEISPEAVANEAVEAIGATEPEPSRPRASVGRMKRMFAWFTGLGIAAKVVLGVTVAAAAGATGIGATAGINTLVSTTAEHEQEQVTPSDDPSDSGADSGAEESGTFGGSVSVRAHELGKDGDGAAFGAEVSGEAQLQGDEHAQNAGGAGQAGVGVEGNAHGEVIAPELPDVVPGGDD